MVCKQSSQCMYRLEFAIPSLRFGDGHREEHEIFQNVGGSMGMCDRMVPHLGLQSQPIADLLVE